MSYKSPNLTVDGVVIDHDSLLLIQRKNHPYQGKWALPGGFVEYNEKTTDAVIREVYEETGLKTKIKTLVGVYSDPSRDPRGHTVSVVYLLKKNGGDLHADDDAAQARFYPIKDIPNLAFDHDNIIKDAIKLWRKQ